MTRYKITLRDIDSVLDGGGMIEHVGLSANETEMIVYVKARNAAKFEKLLEGDAEVMSYVARPFA